ncbi:MAG: DNA-3-methyladenine glycosylase I [Patescibacteria group bacterium UBA2103]
MKNKTRCPWVPEDKDFYIRYHDEEWGVPMHDDQKIFEFLTLESAQAGLSWETILKKREGYRKNFKNFDPKKVAKLTEVDIKKMLQDSSIIRNRKKIEATINNAKRFLEVQKEFGSFDVYMWSFVGGKPMQSKIKTSKDYPAVTKESEAFAKDLKKRGFKFLGPTTVYAHMQASGMVNDHAVDCFRYKEVKGLQ